MRVLPEPELSAGDGVEPLRRLTWRVVHAMTCYYLSFTVMRRFTVSQITINGFVVCCRKHSLLQQVERQILLYWARRPPPKIDPVGVLGGVENAKIS